MGYNDEDDLQMSFGFYEDVEPKKKVQPVERNVSELLEKIDFETEEDALAALIGQTPIPDDDREESDPWTETPVQEAGQIQKDTSVTSPAEECDRKLVSGEIFPSQDNTEIDSACVETSFAVQEDTAIPSAEQPVENTDDSVPFAVDSEVIENPAQANDDDLPPWSVSNDSAAEIEQMPAEENGHDNRTGKSGNASAGKSSSTVPVMNMQTLRRGALGFLAGLKPSGVAMRVPTLLGNRYKADAAAFWLPTGCRTGLQPERTSLALCVLKHSEFAGNSSNREDIQKEWNLAVEKKEELEAVIRQKEPFTKIVSLFEEEEKWDYSLSKNRSYHACLRKIAKLFKALATDTIYGRMILEELADKYYLVSPEGVIQPEEVPEGWGLVWIRKDLTAQVLCAAPEHQSNNVNRTNLALRIAASGLSEQLFANGIDVSDESTVFRPVPKRRRPYSL